MKNNLKKRIIVGFSIIVLVIVVYGVGKSLAFPNSASKNEKVKGLSFENANVLFENNLSTFTVDVYNETKSTYTMKNIEIKLTNKDNESISLQYDIDSLESNEGRKIIINKIDYDLRKYTKISYKINK